MVCINLSVCLSDLGNNVTLLEFDLAPVQRMLLSRLPPKSFPLLVHAAVGVTSLLAIIDPLLIFHLFCLVFLHTWFSFPSLIVVYLSLCSPHVCVELFVVSACAHVYTPTIARLDHIKYTPTKET